MNGKAGAIDGVGRIVIPPVYKGLGAFGNFDGELIPAILSDGRCGFLDRTNKWVIRPQFITAGGFFDGLAAVSKVPGKWYYINEKGEQFTSYQFEKASNFLNGFACVRLGGKTGYLSRKGNLIHMSVMWDDDSIDGFWGQFSEGLGSYKKGKLYGYIDETGIEVIPAQFDFVNAFKDGLAEVQIGHKQGMIGRDGKFVINPKYLLIGPYGFEGGEFGKVKIFGPFRDGLAVVSIAGKRRCIRPDGSYAFSDEYDWSGNFSEGLAAVEIYDQETSEGKMIKSGKFYIDTSGNKVITIPDDVIQGSLGEFHSGLASFEMTEEKVYRGLDQYKFWRTGFIDKTGKIAIEPQFDRALNFDSGIAAVWIGQPPENRMGYIDVKGKFIWNPTK